MEKYYKTGIIMATKLEAEPFIHGFELKKINEISMQIYTNEKIYLAISGIGKSNSAIATTYLINKYAINILFNLGAAGSTGKQYSVGDILHIHRIIEYDRPLLNGKNRQPITLETLKGFNTASLATQDKPVVETLDREQINKIADLVDMEGAAFVQAAKIFKVRSYLFKIVTDTPDHNNNNLIIENIKLTRDSLYEFFKTKIQLQSLT